MNNPRIIKLKPIFKSKIWGGSKLSRYFNRPEIGSAVGEGWLIAAQTEGDCLVSGGPFDGKPLSHVFREHKQLFGNDANTAFPLLMKLIDATDDLSVQVHPDDAYEQRHGRPFGKEETWLIIEPPQDHAIQIGHNAKTKDELRSMISAGQWQRLLKYRHIDADNILPVLPGTLHAIKGGTFLLEVQQASDTTFRVYDYDRLDENGKSRPLHLKEATDVISIPDASAATIKTESLDNVRQTLWTGRYFTIESWNVRQSFSPTLDSDHYYLAVVIKGHGTIDGAPIKQGDGFIITSTAAKITIEGDVRLVLAFPETRSAS